MDPIGVLVSNAFGSRGTAFGSRAPWNSMLVDDRPRAWFNWAMKKGPLVVLGFMGDEMLPSYVGTITNHCKDPYNSILNNQYHGFGQESAPPHQKKHMAMETITIFDRRYIFKWLFFSIVIPCLHVWILIKSHVMSKHHRFPGPRG